MESEVVPWPLNPAETFLPLPRGGLLRNLTIHTSSTSPTGGASVTLVVNGTDTSLVATAPSPGEVFTNSVDEVSVEAGDLVVLRMDWSSNQGVVLRVSLEFE